MKKKNEIFRTRNSDLYLEISAALKKIGKFVSHDNRNPSSPPQLVSSSYCNFEGNS